MAQRTEITVRQSVMGFIDDDQPEMIPRPTCPALFPHERLYGRHNHGRAETGPVVAHLHIGDEAGGLVNFVHGLLNQLLAVGKDERPARLIMLRQAGEEDRFARAGRLDHKLFFVVVEPAHNRIVRLHLIGP